MILGLDPGTWKTGYCIMSRAGLVLEHGHQDNHWVAHYVANAPVKHLAIEDIVGQGRKMIGRETFMTCRWIGRYEERWHARTGHPAKLYSRHEATATLSGSKQGVPKGDEQVADALRGALGQHCDERGCRSRCRSKKCHLWRTNNHSRAAIVIAWKFLQEIT